MFGLDPFALFVGVLCGLVIGFPFGAIFVAWFIAGGRTDDKMGIE